MPFLILAVLWLFVAPFLILGKMTAVEERLNQRIGELMTRLKTLEPVSGPASAPAAPPAWTPVPIPDSDPIPAPTSTWAPLSTPASDFVSPVSTFSVKEHKEHVEEYVEKTAEPETIGTTPDSDQAASNLDDPRRHEEGLFGEAPNMDTPDTDAFDTDASDMYASNMKKARAEGSDFVSPVLLRLRSWLLTEGNIWVCA
ncbi:MAG: hypothetical protein LBT15_00685, partial [Synergistaceae bacterium]|nr:hypothetical protein [Synergistaceae bacterium]